MQEPQRIGNYKVDYLNTYFKQNVFQVVISLL